MIFFPCSSFVFQNWFTSHSEHDGWVYEDQLVPLVILSKLLPLLMRHTDYYCQNMGLISTIWFLNYKFSSVDNSFFIAMCKTRHMLMHNRFCLLLDAIRLTPPDGCKLKQICYVDSHSFRLLMNGLSLNFLGMLNGQICSNFLPSEIWFAYIVHQEGQTTQCYGLFPEGSLGNFSGFWQVLCKGNIKKTSAEV